MKTKLAKDRHASWKSAALSVLLGLMVTAPTVHADIPDSQPRTLSGMYEIASSTDPMFPLADGEEWFLDFGKGVSAGKFSGSVAISLRRNPQVKVRIMAWQYFPKNGTLVIGNPYSEGSHQAVARGAWEIETRSSGVLFNRGNYEIVMHRANPADY